MNAIVKELQNYKQVHFEECKYIWKHFVPQRGQSDYLQGELLRQVEKLRNEACDNGNMNWDDNFVWFCDFLKKTLIDSKLFIEKDEKRIDTILTFLKENPQFHIRRMMCMTIWRMRWAHFIWRIKNRYLMRRKRIFIGKRKGRYIICL